MPIQKARKFLLDGGIVYLYAIFIAGYFLLPAAAGHRRVYYIAIVPAALLLWRELVDFYRGNALAALVLVYTGYMLGTLAWSGNFHTPDALWALWCALCVISFVMLSGYLWVCYSRQIGELQYRAVWLAAGAALVSTTAWYLRHPFPATRLTPLGVMHDPNESSCVYGLFLILTARRIFTSHDRRERAVSAALGIVLLALVLFTQSRTALAAVCVGLLALAGYRALGLIAVAMAASWSLLAANHILWRERVLTFSYRPGIWEQVLADVRHHLWFGQGFLVDTAVPAYGKVFSHAHNSYLATLRDGGIVGLAVLLGLLALAARWGWQLRTTCGERIYLALLLYGATCITMDFDRLLVQPKEIWLFFWLPIALVMAVWGERQRSGEIRQPFPAR